jgi:hypothetical protein
MTSLVGAKITMTNVTIPARPARALTARRIIVGALFLTTLGATVGGLANAGVTGDEIARAAVLSSPTGSAFALNPTIMDHLSTGAHSTGPVRMVGHIVDTGATDLGGPNGQFLAAVRNAGGTVTDAPKTMQIGKRVVLDLRKGADGAAVIATAQASLDAGGAASGVDGGTLARAAVGVYAPELASALPAAMAADDRAFLDALDASGYLSSFASQDDALTVGHLARDTYRADGQAAATIAVGDWLQAHGVAVSERGVTAAAINAYGA